MRRRLFLATVLSLAVCRPTFAANKQFTFKIKTKDGNTVGNVVIEAKDVEGAKAKLMKRYPGCQILGVKTK